MKSTAMPPGRHPFLSDLRRLAYQVRGFIMASSYTCVTNLCSNSFPIFPTLPCVPALFWLSLYFTQISSFSCQVVKEPRVSYLPQLHPFTKVQLRSHPTLSIHSAGTNVLLSCHVGLIKSQLNLSLCPCMKGQFSQLWPNVSCHQVKNKSTDLHVQI